MVTKPKKKSSLFFYHFRVGVLIYIKNFNLCKSKYFLSPVTG